MINQQIFTRITIVFTLLIIALPNSILANKTSQIFKIVEDSVMYYPNRANVQLQRVIASKDGYLSNEEKAFVNYYKGVILFANGNMDSSLVYIQKAVDYFTLTENAQGESKCQFFLGSIAESYGLDEQAKVNYFASIRLSQTKDPIIEGLSYLGLARCYTQFNDKKTSYLEKGKELLKIHGGREHKIFSEYINVVISGETKEEQIQGLIKVSKSYDDIGFKNRSLGALNIVSRRYRSLGKYDSAHYYTDIILDYYKYENNRDAIVEPSTTQHKALIYFNEEDYKNAEIWFKKAVKAYGDYGLIERQYFAYNYLYRLDTIKGDYKKAFEHLSLAFDRKNKTYSIQTQRTSKLAEISSDIAALKHSVKQLEWQKLIVITLSTTGIIIAILIIYIIIRRKNIKQQQIIQNNKELEKIALIAKEKLQVLQKQGIKEVAKIANSQASLIENLEFAYDETYTLLKNSFTILSKTELRYALMFTLDYSSDTMCSLLNVQEAAVRKARQRIRHKLELPNKLALEEFFKAAVQKEYQSNIRNT